MFTSAVPFTSSLPVATLGQPEHIFRFATGQIASIDHAFAASQDQRIETVSSWQRLPNGQMVLLELPQLVARHTLAAPPTSPALEADFATTEAYFSGNALADLELEIYLRTDEERIIDLLDFSEISEEADEDGYVVGYVALAHLIRHHDTLRKYGVFLLRTGPLRAVSADTHELLAASAA